MCGCVSWQPVGFQPVALVLVLMGAHKLVGAPPDSLICTSLWDAFTLVVPELSTYNGILSSRKPRKRKNRGREGQTPRNMGGAPGGGHLA